MSSHLPVLLILVDFQLPFSSEIMETTQHLLRSKLMPNSQQRLLNLLFRLLSSTNCNSSSLITQQEEEHEKLPPNCSISEEEILDICDMTSRYYETIPNIIHLSSPISICGTIRGSFSSLEKILLKCKVLSTMHENGINVNHQCDSLLFLGSFSLDYLPKNEKTRESMFSIEVVLILYCLKVLMPNKVHMLRGNAENRWFEFGRFYEICLERFGIDSGKRIYNAIAGIFLDLPLVAIVDNQVMCVNSGIPFAGGLTEIESEERRVGFESAEYSSMLTACIFHEPEEINGWQLKPLSHELLFGRDVTRKFLQKENLKLIINGKLLCKHATPMHEGLMLSISSAPHLSIPGYILHLERNCKYHLSTFE